MKRMMLCLVLVLGLCGCGVLRRTAYVAVEPHDEDYELSVDSDVITVSSYLSLKNAILNLVEDGVKDGVIRVESYRGDLAEDLSQAVYEVSEASPLGAFAVEHMTYDYSRIVSYYEIHINTTFRRSLDEINAITYVNDTEAVRDKLLEAMESYAGALTLRVGDYTPIDLEDEVAQIYLEHPEFAFENPETSVELYPDSGTQRIIEIKFTYRYSAEQMTACREELQQQLDQIALIYGSSNSELTNAKRFYNRLGRDSKLVPDLETVTPLTNSVYGLLKEDYSTSYGFAQTYLLLLRSSGIQCELITGLKNGEAHSWCLVELEGEYYYVDPSLAANGQSTDYFLLGNQELEQYGYYVWNASELPYVELPEYLKPVQAETE